MYPLDDTIAAIASPQGGAARAILRISGPAVRECVRRVFVPSEGEFDGNDWLDQIAAPTAMRGLLMLSSKPDDAPRLLCEVYLWPRRRSYTGQPVAELHTLGSPPLVEWALRTLCAAGARLAEPGEFTLRAFLAGRLDLTRAEAVLGVIDAADVGTLQVALAQLAGGLAAPLGRLREELLELLAHLEAGFDFAEEDIAFITPDEVRHQLAAAADRVARLVRQMAERGENVQRVRAVLVGWPNTGKSSLFNALAGAAAIVSDRPGTTRDYLVADVDFEGVRCRLIDTAGIDPGGSEARAGIDRAAQEASAEQGRQADLRLLCLDASRTLNDWERAQLAAHDDWLVVLTKVDRPRRIDLVRSAIATSSATGEGLEALRRRIAGAAIAVGPSGEVVAGTAIRCRESLRLAEEALARALAVHDAGIGEELVAAELRIALDELGKVVGAVYTEDVLERIFSRFCVGK
jgi:tRNA modification GTPase